MTSLEVFAAKIYSFDERVKNEKRRASKNFMQIISSTSISMFSNLLIYRKIKIQKTTMLLPTKMRFWHLRMVHFQVK